MLRKYFITSLTLLLVLIIPFTSIAANANNTGALLNDPTLTPEKNLLLKQEAIKKDAYLQQLISKEVDINGYDDGEVYLLNASNFMQETTYWCGPAAVRQSLSFHKNQSGSSVALPSQTTLAEKAGTTTDGSSSTGLVTALNAYASTYSFRSNYVAADVADQSDPMGVFESRIKNDLKAQTNAPIVLLQTKYLPRYGGKSLRHYNTVIGYGRDFNTGSKQLKLADPNFNEAYFGVYWDDFGSTTTNGVFRAVYQADLEGTNKVMIY
jgi:hypothetical protein